MLRCFFQLTGKLFDAASDMSFVRFQLTFARAPCTYPSAQTGKIGAHSRKSWQTVLILGDLHLQPSLTGLSTLCENIQYKHGPVDSKDPAHIFDISDLGGGKLTVKDDPVHSQLTAKLGYLLKPACSDTAGAVVGMALLHHPCHHLSSCGIHQLLQLVKGLLYVIVPQIHRCHKDILYIYLIFTYLLHLPYLSYIKKQLF